MKRVYSKESRENQYRKTVERRTKWVAQNGPCKKCGSITDLHVDHIDPRTKKYRITSIWSMAEDKRIAELAKCQVLCSICHRKKTSLEVRIPNNHGTNSLYNRGCRCEFCTAAHTAYRRAQRERSGKH